MNGYELYGIYNALKLHFKTGSSYDFFKFNGKTRISVDAFEKRRDKFLFHKLARKLEGVDAVQFIVAAIRFKPKLYVRDLLEPEAQEWYNTWRKYYEGMSYYFDQDMAKIFERMHEKNITDEYIFYPPRDGTKPLIWTMMLQNEIHMETVAILHAITGVLDSWDGAYYEDYQYNGDSMYLRKLVPFLNLDIPKFKKIAQSHLTS